MLKTTSGEQTRYRALTRPFSLSEAEYAEMGVACETIWIPLISAVDTERHLANPAGLVARTLQNIHAVVAASRLVSFCWKVAFC